MIAKFFNKTKPINSLILTGLGIVVYLIAVIKNASTENPVGLLSSSSIYLLVFLLFLFLHNFINRKNNMTEDNSYALLIFILLFAFFPNSTINRDILWSNFFLFFAIRRVYSLRSALDTKSKLFDSGFWIGIATIFYSLSISYLLLIYVGLIVFKKVKWNYFLIPVVGFITPLFLYFGFLLLFNNEDLFSKIWEYKIQLQFQNYNALNLLIPIGIILVFILWSIYPTLNKSLKSKKNYKATYTLLLVHLFLAIIIAIVSPVKNGSELLFVFFPFSILFANYLQTVEDYWFKESLLILFLVLAVVINFIP